MEAIRQKARRGEYFSTVGVGYLTQGTETGLDVLSVFSWLFSRKTILENLFQCLRYGRNPGVFVRMRYTDVVAVM